MTDLEGRRAPAEPPRESRLRQNTLRVAGAALLLGLIGFGIQVSLEESGRSQARRDGLAELEGRIAAGDFASALEVADRLHEIIPEHPQLAEAWDRFSQATDINTLPAGAAVYYKAYGEPDRPWKPAGLTPLSDLRLPRGDLRLRIVSAGYEPIEVAHRAIDPSAAGETQPLRAQLHFELDPTGTRPAGMVPVESGGHFATSARRLNQPPNSEFERFWIDRTEVTNLSYQAFVDAGGYESPDHWAESFSRDGLSIPFAEAVDSFRDATGVLGPSGWAHGRHPDGQGDLPVGGVSWYEAAAYCRAQGKGLPTVHHWARAAVHNAEAQEPLSPAIATASNFGDGLARVAAHLAISVAGAYDMAGNVREWVYNPSSDGRFLVGGSWRDSEEDFLGLEARSSWSRDPENGIRCVRYPLSGMPLSLAGPVAAAQLDRRDFDTQARLCNSSAMAGNITVWGAGTARTLRVYWALHELGVPFSRKPIQTRTAQMDDPAFLAVSPGKKIPGFVEGDLVLTESGAIVSYLFDRYARRELDPAQRSEIARWSFFSLTELDATALYVIRRHRDLPEIYGEAPEAVTCAEAYFARQAAVLDGVLDDGREFIAGDAFSEADILLGTCCEWAVLYQQTLPETLLAYHQRLRVRPAFGAANESNRLPS